MNIYLIKQYIENKDHTKKWYRVIDIIFSNEESANAYISKLKNEWPTSNFKIEEMQIDFSD